MTETSDKSSENRYREYLKTELRAAGAYRAMSETEKDLDMAAVFEKLVEAELRHASRRAEKLGMDGSKLELPEAALKLRVLQLTARAFGTGRILPRLLRGEAREIDRYASDPEADGRWPMGVVCGPVCWA